MYTNHDNKRDDGLSHAPLSEQFNIFNSQWWIEAIMSLAVGGVLLMIIASAILNYFNQEDRCEYKVIDGVTYERCIK